MTAQDSENVYCSNCGHRDERAPVTCPQCGDWVNERRLYA